MADNTTLNAGAGGDTIATDDVGGIKFQRIKVAFGADGAATDTTASTPFPVTVPLIGTIPTMISKLLDTSGNSTGLTNATGNYGSTTTDFMIKPTGSQVFRINRLTAFIQDSGVFSPSKYGMDITLTGGILVQIRNTGGTLIQDLTSSVAITGNYGWARYTPNVSYQNWGPGDDYLSVDWNFKSAGTSIRLEAASGEFFTVRLADNYGNLKNHYFCVYGYDETNLT